MKTSINDKIFEGVIMGFLVLFVLITLYPLIYIISCSFSSPKSVFFGEVVFLPKELSVESYKLVFEDDRIWRGYLNTIIYTTVGTLISVFLSFTAAYPLSRKDLVGRKWIMMYYVITMFFSGGLIPTYLLVSNLQILDTMWAFILPGCLSVYNVVVIRTYITTAIPYDVQESAMMDGASGIGIFVRIILPLAKPILAIMALFYLVGYWNSYFNALIYMSSDEKYPLQMVLRAILIENDTQSMDPSQTTAEQAMMRESLKYSSIVVSTVPILFIYPFISKYFEKGLMVGSLKG